MRCVRCHFDLPGGVHFCANCGASLSGTDKPVSFDKTQTLAFSSQALSDGSMFAGRYLVIEELGKGGMGRVYRVLDTKVDEDVALKFINPEIAADVKIIQRFRNELKVTRSITHRHVCRMYDLSECDKSLFITMEYIPGEDLGNMIRRLGRLPVEKAFSIARQVCEGLAEVHRLGVIHRDLKTKNIMIDKSGDAKIMDFGLARTPHGVRLTEVGHVVGTPSFMSPEQLNGETVDQSSDIFSLGVIMFSTLTGELPFKADTALALALLHKTQRPPDPHALNPRVPEELSRIILKCLETDKAKRYPSAQALLADLDRAGEMFDAYSFQVPRKGGHREARGSSSALWVRVVTGVAIAVALAASGLAIRAFLNRSRSDAAHARVLQEITRLIREKDYSSAYRLAEQAEKDGWGESQLALLWKQMSTTLSIQSTPAGASVWIMDTQAGGPEMTPVGLTPLPGVRVPLGRIRLKIEKPGFTPLEDTLSDPGGSVSCLLAEKGHGGTAGPARIDEVVQNGSRAVYKISAGSDQAIRLGDRGRVYPREGGGAVGTEHDVARFTVKELTPSRSLIEAFDLKEDIRLGYLIRLDTRATTVPVKIVTMPPRASILIDEVPLGISDDTFTLAPGPHVIKIRKAGYQEHTGTLVADADDPDRNRYEFKLVPLSPTMGSLTVTSEPSEADVFLDDSPKPAGTTPFTRELRPGKTRLKIQKAGYQPQSEGVDLRAGETSSLFLPLTPLDGVIEVHSDPSGAGVYSGAELFGTTPFKRSLKPAIYKLRIVWNGMGELEDIVTVHPGEQLAPLRFTFQGVRRSVTHLLRVSSDPPGASVSINGVLQPDVTPFVRELDAYEVRIKIEKAGFKIVQDVLFLRPVPDRNEKHFILEKLGP